MPNNETAITFVYPIDPVNKLVECPNCKTIFDYLENAVGGYMSHISSDCPVCKTRSRIPQ